jgi:hypothetical protein
MGSPPIENGNEMKNRHSLSRFQDQLKLYFSYTLFLLDYNASGSSGLDNWHLQKAVVNLRILFMDGPKIIHDVVIRSCRDCI